MKSLPSRVYQGVNENKNYFLLILIIISLCDILYLEIDKEKFSYITIYLKTFVIFI